MYKIISIFCPTKKIRLSKLTGNLFVVLGGLGNMKPPKGSKQNKKYI